MQYQVNPTYQTQEKGFLRILTNVNTRNNDENIFFQPLLLEQQLDTIEMNLNMQNQQNLMIFSRDIGPKPLFGPILGPILGPNIFFSKIRKRHFSRLISG